MIDRDELAAWLRLRRHARRRPRRGAPPARRLRLARRRCSARRPRRAARGRRRRPRGGAGASRPTASTRCSAPRWHWLDAAATSARDVVDARRPALSAGAAGDRRPAAAALRARPRRAARRAGDRDRRQPQPDAAGRRERARLRRAPEPGRAGRRLRAGARHRRRGARGRAGRRAAGTIAVVGTGLDRVYPARHRALAHRIAARRAAASASSRSARRRCAQNFPQRNRIIAGLARGTLVVEAALQSGSLITARLAAEAGPRGVRDSRARSIRRSRAAAMR